MSGRTGTAAAVALSGALALWMSPAAAQTSASHRLTESSLDQGGNSGSTGDLAGASHRVTMSALGGPADGWTMLSSASYRAQGGFVSAYPPPTEVTDLRFADKQSLDWHHETSVGSYQLYRDSLASLGGAFGACLQGGLVAAAAGDPATPPSGVAWGYLVTARNRLGEEGLAGHDSAGGVRTVSAACP